MAFDAIREAKAAYDKALEEAGRESVKKELGAFLADHPEIEAIRIRGGTPSFNDGEPCTFGFRSFEFKMRGEVAGFSADDDAEEDDEDDVDSDKKAAPSKWLTPQGDYMFETAEEKKADVNKKLRKACQKLEETCEEASDLFEDAFNSSGFELIVTAKELTVEDWDVGH